MAKTVSKITTDHQEIIHWVEENRGKPACVKGTGDEKDPGILRFDFPGGASEDHLKHISWDEWFGKFDNSNLALLYQEKKKSGEGSTFFKIVHRNQNEG